MISEMLISRTTISKASLESNLERLVVNKRTLYILLWISNFVHFHVKKLITLTIKEGSSSIQL